jgi:hypothetical protein
MQPAAVTKCYASSVADALDRPHSKEEIVHSARYTDPSDIGARRGAVPGAGAIVSTVDRELSLPVLRQCRMVQLQVSVGLVLTAQQQSKKTYADHAGTIPEIEPRLF